MRVDPVRPGLTVDVLDERAAAEMRASAHAALNGDGTCSLANMDRSCFASEHCSSGAGHTMSLDDLLGSPLAYVATDGCAEAPQRAFVGCVSAAPVSGFVRGLFSDAPIPADALMLSNLCVDPERRRDGVGRRLVARILEQQRPTFLMVARTTDPELRATFDDRVTRLVETYGRLGFKTVGTSEQAYLLQHRGGPV